MAKQKDIFRTLKCYSHGFHTHATEEENKAYDAKVEELKATILADVEHAPEIIADEFAKHQAKMYRSQMQGQYAELICNAEWKAIDNTLMALIDSKPLKTTEKDKKSDRPTGRVSPCFCLLILCVFTRFRWALSIVYGIL